MKLRVSKIRMRVAGGRVVLAENKFIRGPGGRGVGEDERTEVAILGFPRRRCLIYGHYNCSSFSLLLVFLSLLPVSLLFPSKRVYHDAVDLVDNFVRETSGICFNKHLVHFHWDVASGAEPKQELPRRRQQGNDRLYERFYNFAHVNDVTSD